MRRKLGPGFLAAGTTNALQLVFGDFRLGLGDIGDLKTKVFIGPRRAVDSRRERGAADAARGWRNGDDLIDIFNREKLSVDAFVSRLTARTTLLGFFLRLGFGFCLGSVRGRR